jgi:hypothetical protein
MLGAGADDTTVTRCYTSKTCRVLANTYTKSWQGTSFRENKICSGANRLCSRAVYALDVFPWIVGREGDIGSFHQQTRRSFEDGANHLIFGSKMRADEVWQGSCSVGLMTLKLLGRFRPWPCNPADVDSTTEFIHRHPFTEGMSALSPRPHCRSTSGRSSCRWARPWGVSTTFYPARYMPCD